MSINKAIISGNLTRDAELRMTGSQLAVLNFSVAVNERRKNGDQWTDYANFIDCIMFGTRAEKLQSYLTKGKKVALEGKLHWSQWEGKDGNKRSKIEVIVDTIEFMSNGNNSQAPAQQTQSAPKPVPAPQAVDASLYDEDIPF